MSFSARAAVIGAGPNGLAAAVTLARAGIPVTVFEAAETIGGGCRTVELVQDGVLHDVCSAIHPLALGTEFFRLFEIDRRVEFVVPDASYANPLDGAAGDRAAIAFRDLDRTAAELGQDGEAYARLYRPLMRRLEGVVDFALGGSMLRWPADLSAALTTALRVAEQGTALWGLRFRAEAAPALISGVAAHSIGTMPNLATAAVGTVLGALGHSTGWPVPVGGSQAITAALAADLIAHGGAIETSRTIATLDELADYDVKLFDTSTRGMLSIAGSVLPAQYRRALARFRFGNAATKVDFVLDGPIPWRDARVAASPTVHLGGTRAEGAASERTVARGRHPEKPYVLLAQPTSFDLGRNPPGVHAVWSYTHVPRGSSVDVSDGVIAQIERFAPGFRDRIVAHAVTTAADLSRYNRNYVGGDFSSGAVTLPQLLSRPVMRTDPWRTPAPGIYFCSSATSPGPGVHGLSGWYAARSILRHEYGLAAPALGK
ncbi:phytoene dehydrogenase-like protein [Leucobacter luti]|uniref:Phytoene dehydrogenase-like protein n=1 Tax=Leucobacter luti TaxID=340320 RepID=A0A4R6RSA4_9MICO|nr:NAD(P)/FAD-dependent oxidoreductase [Leucobacter luti]TDP89733.1 phytoene dehydrogenase-like protein [Leucobacter luti]